SGLDARTQLFDEAFFAYREDADLAWRSQMLGWKCLYVSAAIGFHVREVLPEKRGMLATQLNLLGVKNRFLLQLNNFSLTSCVPAIIPGLIWRNVVVVVAVFLVERSSRPAFMQVLKLLKRALERRRMVLDRARISLKEFRKWFNCEYAA
ncbi:glycosyltransferase family 2 protein, partial [Oligoflexia bacterium]|nr:glycosyltransferase family 2 protein [Oligoflexia bacterium]